MAPQECMIIVQFSPEINHLMASIFKESEQQKKSCKCQIFGVLYIKLCSRSGVRSFFFFSWTHLNPFQQILVMEISMASFLINCSLWKWRQIKVGKSRQKSFGVWFWPVASTMPWYGPALMRTKFILSMNQAWWDSWSVMSWARQTRTEM